MLHVVDALPEYAGPILGNSHAPDEKIAPWCGQTGHVLITSDDDFRTRWLRSGLLAAEGVEVIVFDKEIKGLPEQHRRVTLHLPAWQHELGQMPYGHRVWVQKERGDPKPLRTPATRVRSKSDVPS